ncbi:MAG: undecaprenyl-diphosphatase, partial [Glaciimonas sp.]|nr:undecaprenyl-diphosphatase [Glaciimonas sp.]
MANVCSAGLDTGFASLDYLQIGFLGIVQGITELLPVSSTAHMRVIPAMLGWRDPGSAFSAAMQLAALLAVVTYFWKDVRQVAVGGTAALRRRDYKDPSFRLGLAIIIATIPICIVGLALAPVLNACNSPLRALNVIGYTSIGLAILLLIAEFTAKHKRVVE